MLDDDTLKDRYTERGVPSEWHDLTPASLAPAFKLWFRALPSPGASALENLDPDDDDDIRLKKAADYAEWLIHDPVAALRDSGIIPDNDEETPRISTMVVNHEKTLNRFIMYPIVVASTNPKTVGITIVKEEAPED